MYEPLWIGVSLPFIRYHPWALGGTPLLVEMAGQLRKVLSSGKGDGGSMLRKLLQTTRRIAGLPERVARRVLQMPKDR